MISKKKGRFLFLFAIPLFLIQCGSLICKNEKRSLVLSYDPLLKTVDIGGRATYSANSSWVKKIIVNHQGFLVVYEQKTAGYKKVPCDDPSKKGSLCEKVILSSHYGMDFYMQKEGYKFWPDLPKSAWSSISSLEGRPSRPAHTHLASCHQAPFGGFFGTLLDLLWAW